MCQSTFWSIAMIQQSSAGLPEKSSSIVMLLQIQRTETTPLSLQCRKWNGQDSSWSQAGMQPKDPFKTIRGKATIFYHTHILLRCMGFMGIHSSQLNTMLCTSLLAHKYFWRLFMGLVLMTTTTTSLDFLMGHLLFWDGWKEEKWDLMNNTNNSNNTRRPLQWVEDLNMNGPSDNL